MIYIVTWRLWRHRHKGNNSTEGGNAWGGPPRSGSDFTRNYLIIVFSFLVIVSFCEFERTRDRRNGWRSNFVSHGEPEHRRGKEHQEKKKVACMREVPSQAPSQIRPIINGYGGPGSLTLDRKWRFRREEAEGEKGRRAAERMEGPKVGERPRGGYSLRPGQPDGSCPWKKPSFLKTLTDRAGVSI